MRHRRRTVTMVLPVMFVLAACSSGKTTSPEVSPSGDIPDNQVFVESSFPAGGFAIKVPEGWARTDSNGTTTYSDKLNRIILQVVAKAPPPRVATVESVEMPAIAAVTSHYEAGQASMVNRPGGAAVLVTYRADAPADPVTGKVVHNEVERYAFWTESTEVEVIVTLSSPVGADNVDPWKTVVDSFRWT